jgi:hypothetical protein
MHFTHYLSPKGGCKGKAFRVDYAKLRALQTLVNGVGLRSRTSWDEKKKGTITYTGKLNQNQQFLYIEGLKHILGYEPSSQWFSGWGDD